MNLLCKILGHRWVPVWNGGAEARGAPCLRCVRCHKMGWKLP